MVVAALIGRVCTVRTAAIVAATGAGCSLLAARQFPVMASAKTATSIYDFTVKDIDDNDVPLTKYDGQVCIIVNVASK